MAHALMSVDEMKDDSFCTVGGKFFRYIQETAYLEANIDRRLVSDRR
jgi:hypothetical protein